MSFVERFFLIERFCSNMFFIKRFSIVFFSQSVHYQKFEYVSVRGYLLTALDRSDMRLVALSISFPSLNQCFPKNKNSCMSWKTLVQHYTQNNYYKLIIIEIFLSLSPDWFKLTSI